MCFLMKMKIRNRKMDKSFIDVSLTVLTVPGYVAFFFFLSRGNFLLPERNNLFAN